MQGHDVGVAIYADLKSHVQKLEALFDFVAAGSAVDATSSQRGGKQALEASPEFMTAAMAKLHALGVPLAAHARNRAFAAAVKPRSTNMDVDGFMKFMTIDEGRKAGFFSSGQDQELAAAQRQATKQFYCQIAEKEHDVALGQLTEALVANAEPPHSFLSQAFSTQIRACLVIQHSEAKGEAELSAAIQCVSDNSEESELQDFIATPYFQKFLARARGNLAKMIADEGFKIQLQDIVQKLSAEEGEQFADAGPVEMVKVMLATRDWAALKASWASIACNASARFKSDCADELCLCEEAFAARAEKARACHVGAFWVAMQRALEVVGQAFTCGADHDSVMSVLRSAAMTQSLATPAEVGLDKLMDEKQLGEHSSYVGACSELHKALEDVVSSADVSSGKAWTMDMRGNACHAFAGCCVNLMQIDEGVASAIKGDFTKALVSATWKLIDELVSQPDWHWFIDVLRLTTKSKIHWPSKKVATELHDADNDFIKTAETLVDKLVYIDTALQGFHSDVAAGYKTFAYKDTSLLRLMAPMVRLVILRGKKMKHLTNLSIRRHLSQAEAFAHHAQQVASAIRIAEQCKGEVGAKLVSSLNAEQRCVLEQSEEAFKNTTEMLTKQLNEVDGASKLLRLHELVDDADVLDERAICAHLAGDDAKQFKKQWQDGLCESLCLLKSIPRVYQDAGHDEFLSAQVQSWEDEYMPRLQGVKDTICALIATHAIFKKLKPSQSRKNECATSQEATCYKKRRRAHIIATTTANSHIGNTRRKRRHKRR